MRWSALAIVFLTVIRMAAQMTYEGQTVAFVDLVSDPRNDVEI